MYGRVGRDVNQSSWDFESFSASDDKQAGSRQMYKTSGDGMGGRRTQTEDDDEPPKRNTRGASQQNRRSNNDDDEDDDQKQKQAGVVPPLGGEGRTIYRLHGDGMGGRRAPAEEAPAKAAHTMSAAKRAELGYRGDEEDDFHHSKKEVEQLGGGNKTIYRTQGDGMGGRKVVAEEEPQRRAPQGMSAAKRAEMGYNDEEEDLNNKMGKVDLLGGGERTIYRTQGDGMGGRKAVAGDEAPRAPASRGISAAKRAELGYQDDDFEEKNTKGAEQLGSGGRTIYRTQGDGMGGRKVVAEEAPPQVTGRGLSAAKRAELGHDREDQNPTGKAELLGDGGRTIYKTSGDGMGGRKGGGPIWGFDGGEPEEQRTSVRKGAQQSSHWDF